MFAKPRSPRYSKVVSAAKKFRPSALIPLIAAHSAAVDVGYGKPLDLQVDAPWVYAALARESLLEGSETGAPGPTQASLRRLYGLFVSSHDEPLNSTLAALVAPLFYEQFPYQESQFEEMARLQILMASAEYGPPFPWEDILGLPIPDAIRASIVVGAWVGNNGGRYDSSILDMPHFQEVFEQISPRSSIEALVSYLTMTVEEARLRTDASPKLPAALRRYSYNPLWERPLVDLGDHGVWAPQSRLIRRAISVSSLYYAGASTWGPAFTNDLGHRTEKYVGDLLRVAAGTQVLGAITYDKSNSESIDWIWVTPAAVVLVESKSARMSLSAQAGDQGLVVAASRLEEGRSQIDRTAACIRQGQPEFAHIPTDRPLVGLLVTSEPFYIGNVNTAENGPTPDTPMLVVSLRELEQLVCFPIEVAMPHLLRVIDDADQKHWNLATTFKDMSKIATPVRNPLLAEAFKAFDFKDERESSATT
ncbi:MAG: hypothetical protein JWP19_2187 [Rhodoglobus sp.]|nr:hypothetical protein [Rhodoglobus sp.]